MLDELERLHKAATPGPWTVDDSTSGLGYDIDQLPCGVRKPFAHLADAAFIAAARNALPALLRVVYAARDYQQAYDAWMRNEIGGLAPTKLNQKEDALFAALAALEAS